MTGPKLSPIMKYSSTQPFIRYLAQDENEIKYTSPDSDQEVTLKTVTCKSLAYSYLKISRTSTLKVQIVCKARGNKINLTRLLGFAPPQTSLKPFFLSLTLVSFKKDNLMCISLIALTHLILTISDAAKMNLLCSRLLFQLS